MSAKPPKPIPRRALALTLVNNPTEAWDTIKVVQPVKPLPIDAFLPDKMAPQAEGTLRFVVISDTHSRERKVTIPPGDVLLHCGDFTNVGKQAEIAEFCEWFGAMPHARKILIAGNHDLSLHGASFASTGPRFGHTQGEMKLREISATCREMIRRIPNCEYLLDSGTCVGGINIWGSPWQPEFCEWAFNLPRGARCREKWRLIPADTDVLLTHGPPLGHGDLCSNGMRAGCLDLLDEVQSRVRPSHHCFGHIHEGFGCTSDGQTTFVNASTCTLQYRPDHPALCFDLPRRDGDSAATEVAGSVGVVGGGGEHEGGRAPSAVMSPAPGSVTAGTGAAEPRSQPSSAIDVSLDSPPKVVHWMDRATEFDRNAEFDRFALYLRPLDESGKPLYVAGATESQQRWGGLHATLCGFAPADAGASVAHPCSLVATLENAWSAAAAATAAAEPEAKRWKLSADAALPSRGQMLMLLPSAWSETSDSRTLRAISNEVSSAGLVNARAVEDLHISMGAAGNSARADAVREALLQAQRWELAIAKCCAGTTPLQVTEFCERKELAWSAV